MGVAQALDDWAIPFSFRTSGAVGELVLFVARRFIIARFAALLNTGITPISSQASRRGDTPWGPPLFPQRRVVRMVAS